MPVRAALLAALAALLIACARESPASRTTAGDTAAAHTNDAPGAVCLQGTGFTADGAVPVQAEARASDAVLIGALRWEPHDGCERVVIDLHTDDGAAAAWPGDVRAEVLRELGVVRITLPGIDRAQPDATDATFGGDLAAAAYSVRADGGQHVFVDVHLARAAEADVSLLGDGARVVIDLRPGGAALPQPAAREQRVVVLQPRPGQAAYPLEITGYSRTFEANVVARLERAGTDVAEQFTTATSWLETWGHFTITIADGPPGALTLHVGEYSARDGTWEGARIPLQLRR